MFALPYGEALQGEAFVHPIVASLREPILRECPALVPKRYEIRLILEASGKYSLLEVPADPAPTKKGEETRQSLLGDRSRGEGSGWSRRSWRGQWGATPAGGSLSRHVARAEPRELVEATYEAPDHEHGPPDFAAFPQEDRVK